MTDAQQPILILGAGINGAALARELVLNGMPVWIVDLNDLAYGATAKSSRLIHGGLRYLEYGDFGLVRESLHERSILRDMAPQFVEPLKLFIPVSSRFGGFVAAPLKFLKLSRFWPFSSLAADPAPRGLWLVRIGLWLYDVLSRPGDFPKHRVHPLDEPGVPQVDRKAYRWLCSYSDARMRFPERFVVALLEDARQIAAAKNVEFRVLPYHRAVLRGATVEIQRTSDGSTLAQINPPLIVNATGPWGDFTLNELKVPSPRLLGGTKGSHFISYQERLRTALGGDGLYAEAADGRLVFVLPFGDAVLVGTTDERFEALPDQAVAREDELTYLVGVVNELFPSVSLTREDLELHYCGVRPLPYIAAGSTASIPRGHSVAVNESGPISVLTLIGGKLTTCRAFAEEVAKEIASRLDRKVVDDSRDRPVPGGVDYPDNEAQVAASCARLASKYGYTEKQIRAMWQLCGNLVEAFCNETQNEQGELCQIGLPKAFVKWVIEREWVTRLDDLVERRLMLLYEPHLTEACLRQLAECLVEAGHLRADQVDESVRTTMQRLRDHYGKHVEVQESSSQAAVSVPLSRP